MQRAQEDADEDARSSGTILGSLAVAFPRTLPIMAGFLVLGISYGFLMTSRGFPVIYPLAMSALIYAGSMEFVTVDLLMSTFNPWGALMLTLMVNARHLFYGLAMLPVFRGTGRKKPYLIFGMCDETFALESAEPHPAGTDKGWYLFFVTLLNQIYWVGGATLGAVLGNLANFDTRGLDFVLTAMFLVLFLEQWRQAEARVPALIGLLASLACLLVFGPDRFIIPSMAVILAVFILLDFRSQREAS